MKITEQEIIAYFREWEGINRNNPSVPDSLMIVEIAIFIEEKISRTIPNELLTYSNLLSHEGWIALIRIMEEFEAHENSVAG